MPQHTKIILTLDPATRARIEDTLAALNTKTGSGTGACPYIGWVVVPFVGV